MTPHKEKVKIARKLQSKEELKTKGQGIFETLGWEKRRDAIARKVAKREKHGKA